jgi:bifunctional UDP-N-acetylglucosamine pyrophosphorylase/glucosamine-1-phosphate N-acetyltransferase/UDP-N-acetylglucosamine pyrophosphorylase
MLRPASVRTLLDAFEDRQADCVLGTATTNDPAGLGRIVREPDGRFRGIVEEKDASPAERLIHEVNMSTYVFEAASLVRVLTRLDTANAAGEYYITDCPRLLLNEGRHVAAIDCLDSSETLSVNTPEQLAAVAAALAGRESPPS